MLRNPTEFLRRFQHNLLNPDMRITSLFCKATMNVSLAAILPSLWLPMLAANPDDFSDDPKFAHAMDVRMEKIDGFPVVFHYGQVRPEFNHYQETPTRRRTALREGW
jgi:hypothetical protein